MSYQNIPIEIILEKLKELEVQEPSNLKHLELEILPRDLPPDNDPFPAPPPNKRVIIIDI